jgi:two-component system NtrC family sensor kinase
MTSVLAIEQRNVQGAGMGLSLGSDIIKAHSGEMKVETKEGEGSTFLIQFPANA